MKRLLGLALVIAAIDYSRAAHIVELEVDECLKAIETEFETITVTEDIKKAGKLLSGLNPDFAPYVVDDPIAVLDLEENGFTPSEGKEAFGKTCSDFLTKVSAVLERNTCQGNEEFVDTLDPSSTAYLYVKANYPKIDEMNSYAQVAWLYQKDIWQDD